MADQRVIKFGLSLGGDDAASRRVHAFELQERISEGLWGWVDLELDEEADPADLVGKEAVLSVQEGQATRWLQGVVLEAAAVSPSPDEHRLRLTLTTHVGLLQLGQDVRLFQEKSVPDVVKEVLEKAGVPSDKQKWSTKGSYAARPGITQYNESDFAFVRRLLAQEGISFALRHSEDKLEIELFDDAADCPTVEGVSTLLARTSTRTDADTVEFAREYRRVCSDAVMLRDYDCEKSALDLTVSEKAQRARGQEVYDHPGRFDALEPGKGRAKRLLERLRLPAHTRAGESDCPFLEVGRKFTLQGHPRGALNDDFLLTSVLHRGGAEGDSEEATYHNRFEAIPAALPLRPSRVPEPAPAGVQVAFVTGPSGAELHGSERGEVKVRFPWDRSGIQDDKSSPWVRVGQLALGGSMIVPRVGFEVIVDHVLSDRDRRVVVGHLYNGEAAPPYELPGGATKSSLQTATTNQGGGANELRFEDAAGSEEIFLNASRDLKMSVEHDASIRVAANEQCKVTGNRSVSVGGKHSAAVTGNRTLKVGGSQSVNAGGDFSEVVSGSYTHDVGGSLMMKVGGDHDENTTGGLSRTVGGLQSVTGIAGYERKIVGASKTQVGAAWTEICASTRSSSCGALRTETVGALKMVKAKTVAVSCGAAYAMNAASEQVNCGENRVDEADGAVMVTAGGGFSGKATNINITGENRVLVRVGGSSIEVTKGGVKIKSPKIDLKNVKKIGSGTHNTN